MQMISLIPDGSALTYTPVWSLSVRIHTKISNEGKGTVPTQSQLFMFLFHLLDMLLVCYPDTNQALKYVKSNRYFRKRRIERETRRLLTAFPEITPETRDSIVRSIFDECEKCTFLSMRGYLSTVEAFQV